MKQNDFEEKLKHLKVPEVKMEEHQKQLKKSFYNIRKTAMLGTFLLLVLSIGGNLVLFLSPAGLLVCLGVPFALIVTTYGFKGLKIVFIGPFNLNVTGEEKIKYLSIFKDLKTYFIVAGWIGFIIGLILLLLNIDYTSDSVIAHLAVGFGMAVVTVFYGYIFAYCFSYPIQRRLENNPD